MDIEEARRKTLYEVLGVSQDASLEKIKEIYREIARVYHPDSNFYSEIVPEQTSPEQVDIFKIITAAYNTLTDPKKRAEYDAALESSIVRLKGWDDDKEDFWRNADSGPSGPVAEAESRVTTGRVRRTTTVFGQADVKAAVQADRGKSGSFTPVSDSGQGVFLSEETMLTIMGLAVVAGAIVGAVAFHMLSRAG